MPSSGARKQRRSELEGEGEEVRSEVSPARKMRKGKFGRHERREINRSMSRKRRRGGDEEEEEDEEERSGSEDTEGEDGGDGDGDGDDNDDGNNMVYGTLVTMLRSDYGEGEADKGGDDESQVVDYRGADEAENGADSDGAGSEDSGSESEDGGPDSDADGPDSEDGESGSSASPFVDSLNSHFNDEERIAELVSEYEDIRRPLKLMNRVKLDDYVKLDYRYDDTQTSHPIDLKSRLEYHNVKKRVQAQYLEAVSDSQLEAQLIDSMLTYQNVELQYYHSQQLKKKYQTYYVLHCLNHILKSRTRVMGDTEKKKRLLKQIEDGEVEASAEDQPEFRDQGYTRPKVLILLPTRNSAWEVVSKMIELSPMQSVENKKRFREQYYDSFGSGSSASEMSYKRKPEDFRDIFKGNSNDFFCLGIKLTRKTIRLYTRMDQSDVIVASPLGLKMLFENSSHDKRKDTEFLSSIEIAILDKCEGLLMQNWEHVTELLNNRLNAPPKKFEEFKVDFSRIRMWAINDQYKYVTQMMVFGKYGTPELNGVVKGSRVSCNLQSGTAVFKPYVDGKNSIIDLLKRKLVRMGMVGRLTKLKQMFTRFEVDTISSEPDKRFEFFKNVTLPQIMSKASYDYGTLVYVANYVDYIRLTNYLKESTSVPFVAIDEYSSQSKLTRNRASFAEGRGDAKVMLYTERLHFYKRYDIKGVRNVVFYQLPTDPDVYSQVMQFVVDEKIRREGEDEEEVDLNLCMVRVMFDRLDMMKLEKVVGLRNAGRLCNGDGEMNEFS
ncbi:DEKNAAC102028 [Brettanomyces naardenensis]|uniref:U3 small nucleolar RNA-associated protein 25 n=1 Tax=Brettanomyces naardenensis TaxID=13370 RepID=A0A448YJJ4_BRENA|nr:DEKNAAC102028 [Brettanomyces naardenensis]